MCESRLRVDLWLGSGESYGSVSSCSRPSEAAHSEAVTSHQLDCGQLLTVRRVPHLRGVRPLAGHGAAGRQLPPRPRPRPRLLLGLQLAAHRGHLLVGEGRPRPGSGLAILAVLLLGARLADLLVPVPGVLPRGGLRVVVDEVTAISFV